MGLTNAEKQRRWRGRRNALARTNSEVVEGALLQQAERCRQLSDQERIALADRLADVAMRHLWRAHALNEIAKKVRAGEACAALGVRQSVLLKECAPGSGQGGLRPPGAVTPRLEQEKNSKEAPTR